MLCSLSGLYNNFLIKNGYQIDKNTGRLMVQSVKEGSMILDLIAPVLPIANDLYNSIEDLIKNNTSINNNTFTQEETNSTFKKINSSFRRNNKNNDTIEFIAKILLIVFIFIVAVAIIVSLFIAIGSFTLQERHDFLIKFFNWLSNNITFAGFTTGFSSCIILFSLKNFVFKLFHWLLYSKKNKK